MPDFHPYLPKSVRAMVDRIMDEHPDESLSALFADAVRTRYQALFECGHHTCRCVECGATVRHR
jgi:hypothetical protein